MTNAALVQPQLILHDRYAVIRKLGEGGQAVTWLADDRRSNQQVVVKELSLRRIESVSAIELFEREAKVLESLKHRCIPSYIDYFETHDDQQRFYLVQEYVEGLNFQEHIEQGTRFTEAQVLDFTRQIIETLDYLQEHSPPVIHRDIKPSNLILHPDGRVVLVDFGAVHRLECQLGCVETMIGTTGYMPPEQFTGRTLLSSDLYSVGATLVHLLSHRHPGDLPLDGMKLRFAHLVNVSEDFAKFLDILLEPVAEDRFNNAKEALEWFEKLGAIDKFEACSAHEIMTRAGPPGTQVVVKRTTESLDIHIPSITKFHYLKHPPGGWIFWGVLAVAVPSSLWALSIDPPNPDFEYVTDKFSSYNVATSIRYYSQLYLIHAYLITLGFVWILGLWREFRTTGGIKLRIEPEKTFISRRSILGRKRTLGLYTGTLEVEELVGRGNFSSIELQGIFFKSRLGFGRHEKVTCGRNLSREERGWIVNEMQSFLKEHAESDAERDVARPIFV